MDKKVITSGQRENFDQVRTPTYEEYLSSSVPVENSERGPQSHSSYQTSPHMHSDVSNVSEYSVGDMVRYAGSKSTRVRLCGRKHLEVIRVNGEWIEVRHKDWAVTQTISRSNLTLVRKANGSDDG